MRFPTDAQVLFELIDHELGYTAEQMRNQIFSLYRDKAWTPEERKVLAPVIRKELDSLLHRLLGIFGNIGGVIPDNSEGVIGYAIHSYQDAPDGSVIKGSDISFNEMDYADMWLDYLEGKDERENK